MSAAAAAYPSGRPRRTRLSPVLSAYVARRLLASIAVVTLGFAVLAFVLDAIELMRQGGKDGGVGLGLTLGLAALHLPFLLQTLVPFAVLYGAMLGFRRLNRTHELVAARALGVSVWQVLLPTLVSAVLLGALVVGAFNPLAAALLDRYQTLLRQNVGQQQDVLSIAPDGLWLRQRHGREEFMIHALYLAPGLKPLVLHGVTAFAYEDGGRRFVRRVDAPVVWLRNGRWHFDKALVSGDDGASAPRRAFTIPSTITPERILNGFAPPEALSFWDLPGFIRTLENLGFSTRAHRLYWHRLTALPLLLAATLLIGMTVSLRLVRRGGTALLVVGGLLAGFAFHILSDVVLAVGQSGQIPAALAAWMPTGVALLLGVAALFHIEDG